MAKSVRRFILWVLGEIVTWFVEYLWAGAGAATVMAALSYFAGWNPPLVFLGSLTAFTVASAGLLFVSRLSRSHAVFRNIAISAVDAPGSRMQGDVFTHLTLRAHVCNKAERRVFIKIRNTNISVQDNTRTDAVTREETILLYPGQDQTITFATLHDVPIADKMIGRIEMEVLYGSKMSKLKYLFSYEGELAFGTVANHGGVYLNVLTMNKKIEHSRSQWF